MSFLLSLIAKSIAGALQLSVLPRLRACPDKSLDIPSRDAGRSIKLDIYYSSTPSQTSPVLINFHGSSFLVPLHGSDGEFCRRISRKTSYTVLDVQYRLTPENPYPAAPNDAEDVVHWVQEQQRQGLEFTDGRIALSGFSAGGNLSLGAPPQFPSGTFHAILAFYPWLDLDKNPWFKFAPNPLSLSMPAWVLDICRRCYLVNGEDARDPRVSPVFAPVERFPERVYVATASCDTLAFEGEELVKRMNQAPERRRSAESERMGWLCGHGWDKFAFWGTPWWWTKERAYTKAVALLES